MTDPIKEGTIADSDKGGSVIFRNGKWVPHTDPMPQVKGTADIQHSGGAPAVVKAEKPDVITSVGRGAAQGVTLGFADEIAGVVRAIHDREGPLAERYRRGRDESRKADVQAKEAHPVAYGVGEVGAGLVTAGIPGLAGVRAATRAKAIIQGAKTGAATAGISATGRTEADLTKGEFKKAAKDVAVAVPIGAAAGALFTGASRYMSDKAAKRGLEKVETLASQRTGQSEAATRPGMTSIAQILVKKENKPILTALKDKGNVKGAITERLGQIDLQVTKTLNKVDDAFREGPGITGALDEAIAKFSKTASGGPLPAHQQNTVNTLLALKDRLPQGVTSKEAINFMGEAVRDIKDPVIKAVVKSALNDAIERHKELAVLSNRALKNEVDQIGPLYAEHALLSGFNERIQPAADRAQDKVSSLINNYVRPVARFTAGRSVLNPETAARLQEAARRGDTRAANILDQYERLIGSRGAASLIPISTTTEPK